MDESLKVKSKWGGARPGAGHPKGKKTQVVIEREAAAKVFKERVAKHADKLFNAQLDLAIGEKYLMVKTTTGEGKNRKTTIEIVTDTEIIKQFLDDEVSLNNDMDHEYYFISTKPANNMALDSLLNRSFGKAEDKLDITTGGDKISGGDPLLAKRFTSFMEGETLDGQE